MCRKCKFGQHFSIFDKLNALQQNFPPPKKKCKFGLILLRVRSLKDEAPWKIRASIMFSIRAHNGALRSRAVSQDECRVFTAGTGLGIKGSIQKWEVSRLNCVSSYYHHEDVCTLRTS
ncbi:protein serine/threonine kinase protein tyrosine kinase ATP binding protein kinase [Euphorbia peplus]|nr:protein serine/threonine kinase protein tyrosine kinase ATP binding protein kinase [Euphorbia peplus]